MSGVYTAKIGGLWDGLLGEGRNFFIYVSSDWHNRGMAGARDPFTTSDFIPGADRAACDKDFPKGAVADYKLDFVRGATRD